jgi:phosphate butyryltransferase
MRINFENIKNNNDKTTIVVAGANDHIVLEALDDASKKISLNVILIGNEIEINKLLKDYSLKVKKIINESDPIKIGEIAVQCIKNNEGNVIMKGLIDTKHVLKAVVNSTNGIRKQKMLSHVAIMDYPKLNNSLIISDCAMNIAPNAEDK